MDEKNAQTLKTILKLLNDGRVTPDDLAKATKAVLNVVRDLKEHLEKGMEGKHRELSGSIERCMSMVRAVEDECDRKLDAYRSMSSGEIASMGDFITTELMRLNQALGNIKEYDDSTISEQIEELRQTILDLPEQLNAEDVRDRLEAIPDEEDKLKIEAIGHLREELDALKKAQTQPSGGGIAGRDLFKDYDLSSQLDGATKTFNIPATWNIISVSLSSFPHVLRKGIDFTYTPQSITFTDQIDAAVSLAAGQTCVLTIISA